MYWVPASREAYRENGISKLKVSSVYTPPPPIRGTDCTQTIKELRPACQTVCVTCNSPSRQFVHTAIERRDAQCSHRTPEDALEDLTAD